MCCATSARELVFSPSSCLMRMMFVLFLSPGIISTFLHVHPFGASIEYICSYLQRLDSKVGVPAPPSPPEPAWLVCLCSECVWSVWLVKSFIPSLGMGRGLDSRNRCVLTGIICWKRMRERMNFLKITEAFGLGGTFKDHLVHPLAVGRGIFH